MSDELLPDTWYSRDRPLLVEILRRIDSGDGWADAGELRTALGYDNGKYWAALQALKGDGYLPDEVTVHGPIGNVSGKARRELGTWPTPENMASQLVAALEVAEAEEDEPTRKRALATLLDSARGVGVDVLARIFEKQLGL